MPISAETALFLQKQLYFGRNETISAEYSVSAKFRFFKMACFGKKSVSVEHIQNHMSMVGGSILIEVKFFFLIEGRVCSELKQVNLSRCKEEFRKTHSTSYNRRDTVQSA